MGLIRSGLLWASRQEWLGDQFRKRPFSRRAVSRFMPGEDLDSALDAARRLAESGIPSVLTLLGENLTDLSEADAVRDHYLTLLSRAEEPGLTVQPSVKPTQLGLDLDADTTYLHLDQLMRAAGQRGTFVWIDMESAEYVDRTLDLYRRLRAEHENAGLCLQAYLHRTPADLESLASLKPTVRLVKGAYREPPEVAIQKKRDVDRRFYELGTRLLRLARDTGRPQVLGTHDMDLVRELQTRAHESKLPNEMFEFHMLYGIAREDQQHLARTGKGIRVLISYGSAWFPWYMRRLAERPANLAFVIRSVLRA